MTGLNDGRNHPCNEPTGEGFCVLAANHDGECSRWTKTDRYIPEVAPQPLSAWSDAALVLAAKRAFARFLSGADSVEAHTRLTRIAHRLMREERARGARDDILKTRPTSPAPAPDETLRSAEMSVTDELWEALCDLQEEYNCWCDARDDKAPAHSPACAKARRATARITESSLDGE